MDILIIGAGQIAAGYDNPAASTFLTHAHAWKRLDPQGSLYFYDPQTAAAESAAAKWGARALTASELEKPWDIITIASPDFTHLEWVERIASWNWKALVLEKPPVTNLSELARLKALLAPRQRDCLINFMRRHNPEMRKQQQLAAQQSFGKLLSATCHYGNGWIHNGSHLYDWLEWMVGPLSFQYGKPMSDADLEMLCRDQNHAPCFFHPVPKEHYTILEATLHWEHATLSLRDSGFQFETRVPQTSPLFAGQRKLGEPTTWPTHLGQYAYDVAAQILAHLQSPATIDLQFDSQIETFSRCLQAWEFAHG